MSEATIFNAQAFQPFDGGMGALLTVTAVSESVLIPGTQGVDRAKLRVLVVNDNPVSISVRMGQSGVQSTLACLKVLPGCAYLLTPPNTNPSGVWIAAICATGETADIQATAGNGT